MAESDKIKGQDLIQDNVFENTTKSAKELEVELSKLVVGFEGIIKANNEMLKLNKDPKTALEIKNVNELLDKQQKARIALNTVNESTSKLNQQLKKEGIDEIKLKREQQKETDKATKEQQKQNGAYKEASDRLRDVKKALKDLDVQGKHSTDEFKKLNDEFKTLDGVVRKADAKVGEFGRNVGNYSGKFNGLGNSVNQLTREMPAFANSMQTGFMAISNNLPIFFDEITKTRNALKEMQAEGKQVPSLFSSIASSIFTWGTALSIGVTILTVYGKQIVEFIGHLFDAENQTISLINATEKHHEVMRDFYIKKRDLILSDAVNSKKITEEEAIRFKSASNLRIEIAKEEKEFTEARKKSAK